MALQITELHETRWLWIELARASESGRTHVWHVRSKSSGDLLGRVAWFGRWRQYAFHPVGDTVYNAQCMRDLADFCEWQNREKKRRDEEARACGTASRRRKR